MGLAGFLGSLISVSMYARYLRGKSSASKPMSTATKGSTAPRGMEHVPGMPTFDVEGVKRGSHQQAPPGMSARPGELSSPQRQAAEQGEPPARPREAGEN
jgi:hypothetical protein